MESLKLFRARYGFTQQVAATLLDVNLAQVALAETGKRSLPFKASEKMRMFEEIAESAPVADDAGAGTDYNKFLKQEYQKERTEVIRYAKECEYRLQTLQRKLAPLQERRTNALLSLALISHLRLIRSLSKGELSSIKKAEADLRRSLRLVPQSTIDKLTFEIEALEFTNNRIDKKLTELNRLIDTM